MTEYLFAKGSVESEGKLPVSSDRYYTETSGYGFFTERSVVSAPAERFPELNTGFLSYPGFQRKIEVFQDEIGCYVNSGKMMEDLKGEGEFRIPLSFKADTREQGMYRLSVRLCAKEEEREVLLFAGRRQLVWKGRLRKGEEWSGSFLVFICDYIPRGEVLRYKKTGIEVTVISKTVHLAGLELEKWKGQTIWIAGDSTVTDQTAFYPYAPELSYGGWGQMLPFFFGGTMAVSNHAHSGLTTESFKEEGHYKILSEYVQPGDMCLFQFGHNDQKLEHLKAEGGYRDHLKWYIQDMKEKGVIPVLVTPLARNSWRGSDERYLDLLEQYAIQVRMLGEDLSVPVLDLHERSMNFIKEEGLEESKRWFYPADFTHTNDYGAWKMAEFIWEELLRAGFMEKENETNLSWEPPENIKTLCIPDSLEEVITVETGESAVLERPEEILTRAEALDFVIRAVHYFPTNVYNDPFEDIVGHEWYAGVVECAFQNGLIPKEMTVDNCFHPDSPILLEEFLWIAMTGYQSRKRLPRQNVKEIEGTFIWTRESVKMACELGLADYKEYWRRNMTRREAAKILGSFKI